MSDTFSDMHAKVCDICLELKLTALYVSLKFTVLFSLWTMKMKLWCHSFFFTVRLNLAVFHVVQIDTYWIPLIHRVIQNDERKPVVLVGNKSDILESSSMEVGEMFLPKSGITSFTCYHILKQAVLPLNMDSCFHHW